jgi:predicted  nucleic acid-binding Zn-ribbon protein
LAKLKEKQELLEMEMVKIKERQDNMERRQNDLENSIKENKERQELTEEESINIQKRQDDQEKSIQELDKKIQELSNSKADDSKIEDIKRTYAEAAKDGKVDEVLQDFKRSMDIEREQAKKMLEETKERIQQEKDRESRKNNIIIHRVEENASSSPEDRQKYDRQWVKELTKEVLKVQCSEDDIKRVFRLGAKGSTDRPLLIEYRSHIIKKSGA